MTNRDGTEQVIIRPDLERKSRGAFFTPEPIAEFLANWAVHGNPDSTVLDPTCGEAVFLLAAARRLRALGSDLGRLDKQVLGVDLHRPSLKAAMRLLESEGLDARLIASDFFELDTPLQLGSAIPLVDAVIGNPPFVRYQDHKGLSRQRSRAAALKQGIRLSGLASSWAAMLVHASGFLKPDGRLAMVLPAELLTVNYAEPVRQWLKRRFSSVNLIVFEQLQFQDVLERVVLLLAHGSGGCDSFTLTYVNDASDLASLHFGDGVSVIPSADGKWTDLLLPLNQRQLFRRTVENYFTPLSEYGTPELGTVTGANDYFTLSETTRERFELDESHLSPICPPGTRHLKGLAFGTTQWRALRERGERIWLLNPATDDSSAALRAYILYGERLGVNEAYKCQIRSPWWCPPVIPPPDLFFTYMSHRYPRLISNPAKVGFVNSMHGIRLRPGRARLAKSALPLLAFNSVTMLGAELHGRSYGGGVLKMEPREAADLPLPAPEFLGRAWEILSAERDQLDRQLQAGLWTNVAKRVDEALIVSSIGLGRADVVELHAAAGSMRGRRLRSHA